MFLDVPKLESASALGPGGSPSPAPSAPRPTLALSVCPWLPILPSSSFRRGGETSVQHFLDSPPRGRELPLRLRGRTQPLLGSYASRGRTGRGAPRGQSGSEASPHPGSPVRCLRGGSGRLSSVGCSPYPMAPRQRLQPGSWRAFPPRRFLSGTVRAEGEISV